MNSGEHCMNRNLGTIADLVPQSLTQLEHAQKKIIKRKITQKNALQVFSPLKSFANSEQRTRADNGMVGKTVGRDHGHGHAKGALMCVCVFAYRTKQSR